MMTEKAPLRGGLEILVQKLRLFRVGSQAGGLLVGENHHAVMAPSPLMPVITLTVPP